MFRELIPRTVVALSIATAVVALSIAFQLPQLGGAAGVAGHGAAAVHDAAGAHAVSTEAEFLAGMLPHHQEAVDAARSVLRLAERPAVAPDGGARAAATPRPEVLALAEAIVGTQAREIRQIEAWLASWYPDEPSVDYEPMMRTLEGLTPAEVDQVFVADMIRHHEMAVDMAEQALALDPPPRPEVAALARDVIREQSGEIERLTGWLESW